MLYPIELRAPLVRSVTIECPGVTERARTTAPRDRPRSPRRRSGQRLTVQDRAQLGRARMGQRHRVAVGIQVVAEQQLDAVLAKQDVRAVANPQAHEGVGRRPFGAK